MDKLLSNYFYWLKTFSDFELDHCLRSHMEIAVNRLNISFVSERKDHWVNNFLIASCQFFWMIWVNDVKNHSSFRNWYLLKISLPSSYSIIIRLRSVSWAHSRNLSFQCHDNDSGDTSISFRFSWSFSFRFFLFLFYFVKSSLNSICHVNCRSFLVNLSLSSSLSILKTFKRY